MTNEDVVDYFIANPQLDFAPGADPANAIEPADIAVAVNMVLEARPETVFDEITLSPLKKVIEFSF